MGLLKRSLIARKRDDALRKLAAEVLGTPAYRLSERQTAAVYRLAADPLFRALVCGLVRAGRPARVRAREILLLWRAT